MAILGSDTFGVSTLAGSSFNNGLGGSGSFTWNSTGANVTASEIFFSGGGRATFDAGDANDKKLTILYKPVSAGKNWALIGRTTVTAENSCFGALIVGLSALRISEWNNLGSRTDRASVTTSLDPTQYYKFQVEFSGMTVIGRILTTADAVFASVAYTTSITPGGSQQNWGLFDISGATSQSSRFDDLLFESVDAPAATPVTDIDRSNFRGTARGISRGVF